MSNGAQESCGSLWPPFGGDVFDLALGAMQGTAAAGALVPLFGSSSRELANKLRAFGRFREASNRRRAPDVSRLDPYDALWSEEGFGYGLGRALEGEPETVRLALQGAPRRCRLARVSGCGLALAIDHVQRSAEVSASGATDRVDAVDSFVSAVEATIPWPHRLVAFENLGLAVRTLRPEALAAWGDRAARHGFAAAFWHGAGRGLYFAPSHLVSPPGLPWSALDRAIDQAPAGFRSSSVAGLAWALTLVNIRHPRLVAERLAAVGARPGRSASWAGQGMAAAWMLWLEATGDETRPRAFERARLAAELLPAARWVETWARHELLPEDRVAELFQYSDLRGAPDASIPK